MKSLLRGLAVAVLALFALFFAGPRPVVDTHLKPLALPADLDAYLAQSEARFTDLTPSTQKGIVWAHADQRRTPLALVYLHGYSATRRETAPLADHLAAQLGANLFYTRLTGHGRGGAALGEASINDWLNDAHEALAIGRRLGEKVLVIGTSTGGTLATWLALQPAQQADPTVLGYVLISPNFGPRDHRSVMLTWPWGAQIARAIVGQEFVWPDLNADHARYWTHRHPSKALVPMMGLVVHVRDADLARFTQPVQVIYSPDDRVVDAQETERQFVRFGSSRKSLVALKPDTSLNHHVLAGDIVAPGNTARVEQLILDFIATLR
ncbi:MAG: alpha/beta fold hydrolase [Burkholderiales bacterium]